MKHSIALALLIQISLLASWPALATTCAQASHRFAQISENELTRRLEHYSRDRRTELLTSKALKDITSKDGSMNSVPHSYCYRYVKKALQGTWTEQYLQGVSAEESGSNLEAIGFVNLLCHPDAKTLFPSPYEAPNGAVLVYEGGSYGHTEVRVINNHTDGFVSDYFCSTARTGRAENGRYGRPTSRECDPYLTHESRRLIGIYVKL